jgi:dienelactone hydrolase
MEYFREGYDVFCPNLLGKDMYFPYENAAAAYDYFIHNIGFDVFDQINELINRLKKKYKKVFAIGFSIGATVAFRCSENLNCDGIICCYGSRIRDYLYINPRCPALLLFAKQDSFPVNSVINVLEEKKGIEIVKLNAHHGFLDQYSEYYDSECTAEFSAYRKKFLKQYE